MKRIPAIDKQFKTRIATDPAPVVHGYNQARRKGLDLMILSDFGLSAEVVPAIVESLRTYGISQVAVTTRSSGTLDLLWAFKENGATFELDVVDSGQIEDLPYMERFVRGFVITLN